MLVFVFFIFLYRSSTTLICLLILTDMPVNSAVTSTIVFVKVERALHQCFMYALFIIEHIFGV